MLEPRLAKSKPVIRRSLLCALLVGVSGALCLPMAWRHLSRAQPDEILLRDTVLQLSPAALRAVSLVLKHAGEVEIEVTAPAGEPFNLYLVTRGNRVPVSRLNEFRLIEPFTAEGVTQYRRVEWIGPGEYQLTLIRTTSHGPGSAPIAAHVRARLKRTRPT